MFCPFTQPASSESSHDTIRAMSIGVPSVEAVRGLLCRREASGDRVEFGDGIRRESQRGSTEILSKMFC
jgi:hypothetical protein